MAQSKREKPSMQQARLAEQNGAQTLQDEWADTREAVPQCVNGGRQAQFFRSSANDRVIEGNSVRRKNTRGHNPSKVANNLKKRE